jgi:hypothetical protein
MFKSPKVQSSKVQRFKGSTSIFIKWNADTAERRLACCKQGFSQIIQTGY